jgi:phosphohistidine phosphatase
VITLHLVRHADAAPGDGRDDAARPLTLRGVVESRTLARSLRLAGAPFDLVCSSPRRRALQTAALLWPEGPDPTVVEELGAGDVVATAAALARACDAAAVRSAHRANVIVAVGHEPWLSQLTAYLLTGDPGGIALRFRKATVATLEGRPAAGDMALVDLVPIHVARALLEAPAEGGAPD